MQIPKIFTQKVHAFALAALLMAPVAAAQHNATQTLSDDCFRAVTEKVFLLPQSHHLVSGQSVAYSAVVLNAATSKPSTESKVLYLELKNAWNQTILRWRSQIQQACAQGTIQLPDTLSAGIYTLTACTNWMGNNDAAFAFSTQLLIHPIAETYPVELPFPVMPRITPTPNADPSISIGIDETPTSYLINVQQTGSNPRALTCQLSNRGTVVLHESIGSQQPDVTITIDKAQLPKGIVAIEVIDQEQVVAARLMFNRPQANPLTQANLINGDSLQWHIPADGTLLTAIAIRHNAPEIAAIAAPSIDEYLMFQSEIRRGSAWPKGSWMKADSILSVTPYADYLWNRNEEHAINHYRENRTTTLTGYITASDTTELVAGKAIFLSSPDSVVAFKYSVTDANGRFAFVLDSAWHNRQLMVQTDPTWVYNGEVQWHFTTAGVSPTHITPATMVVPESITTNIEEYGNIHLINTIFQPSTPKDSAKALVPIPLWQVFKIAPNYTVKPADFEDLPNFEEIANNILPTVKFNQRKDRVDLAIYSVKLKQWLNNCTVFLNSVPFGDLNYIATLSSKDIRTIEIYNIPILYGDIMFNGMLSITTHHGTLPKTYVSGHTRVTQIVMTSDDIRMPCAPQKDTNERIPDLRPTILYAPFGETGNASSIALQRCLSHLGGACDVIIEGISSEGTPYSINQVIIPQSR